MSAAGLSRRFLDTTRGQIVAHLRTGARTVDELAVALGLTDNAIRSHLSTLERDGLVKAEGVRRGSGAGKPATLYVIEPNAELLFSRAYAPMLSVLLEELIAQLPAEQASALLQDAGRRLAKEVGTPRTGDHDARLRAAVALLGSFGAETRLERGEQVVLIRGCGGCPLGAAVARRPELCGAMEALLSEVVGSQVRQRCDHGERPRCCFEIPAAA